MDECTYDIDSPRGELASLNGSEQPLDTVVGVLTSKLPSLVVRESLRIRREQIIQS
jgi:hypothetical protein